PASFAPHPRSEDAEGPAIAVLRRIGAVRVEHVALEEDRVGDGARPLEPGERRLRLGPFGEASEEVVERPLGLVAAADPGPFLAEQARELVADVHRDDVRRAPAVALTPDEQRLD